MNGHRIVLCADQPDGKVELVHANAFIANLPELWEAIGFFPAELEGLRGRAAREVLTRVISDLEAAPHEWVRYDSPCGWGNYQNLLAALRTLLRVYGSQATWTVRVDP